VYIIHFAERILAQKDKFGNLLQTENAEVHIDWKYRAIPFLSRVLGLISILYCPMIGFWDSPDDTINADAQICARTVFAKKKKPQCGRVLSRCVFTRVCMIQATIMLHSRCAILNYLRSSRRFYCRMLRVMSEGVIPINRFSVALIEYIFCFPLNDVYLAPLVIVEWPI
jgi:hypothetical protein